MHVFAGLMLRLLWLSLVVGQKANVFTSKIASADLVAPLVIDNLSTGGIVCSMDVRYNSVSCISGIAWLTCDTIVDVVAKKWLPDFTKGRN